MKLKLLLSKRWLLTLPTITYDLLAIPVALLSAVWLRGLDAFPFTGVTLAYAPSFLVIAVMQVAIYTRLQLYRGVWQFSSLPDFMKILKTVFLAVVFSLPILYLLGEVRDLPRSLLPIYGVVLIGLWISPRLLSRLYSDKMNEIHLIDSQIQRVLIIGAGQAGEGLVRDLRRHAPKQYRLVGFVDDDPRKQGLEIRSIRVLGAIRNIANIVSTEKIDLIFIAMPSARSATMRRIVGYCEKLSIPFRTLPSLAALATGQVNTTSLREVKIEDLLGRDEVQLEWQKISEKLTGKRILVTGGGGSIGSELCLQIASQEPAQLLIVDNGEYNLYQIEMKLRTAFPALDIQVALISVTDEAAVQHTFSQFQPEIIFHAAAYKHVPLLEHQVRVAVRNNVLGTEIVSQAAVAVGAEKFILISTDKAVNPTSLMGATKRVAEIYCQNLNMQTKTQFITVRFGNVLGSTGSVIPLFREQLAQGGPITVTHPDVTRYFMTIPEACQLILQAMVNGQGGEIFVLDMGEAIKIHYLAEQMIRLAGKVPGKDIDIIYTGLRPGEKLFEELFLDSEELQPTQHEKIYIAKHLIVDWQTLTAKLQLFHTASAQHDDGQLQASLFEMVALDSNATAAEKSSIHAN